VLKLLNLETTASVLDLGCGQGILSRTIPVVSEYLGIDSAPSLIEAAKKANRHPQYRFLTADVTRTLPAAKPTFTHAAIILALQNMEKPEIAVQNAAAFLVKGGRLVLVLNHPMFRIPRQSGWGIDEKTKQQYRWINRYASPLKIPINMTPGQRVQTTTWSFHRPLSEYVSMLASAGFVITGLEEWLSDKQSQGKAAKMENRSREEIPLFMAIVAEKLR
jgi:ubiquinone/menaquinone biosynthesis C-methylase UbiE